MKKKPLVDRAVAVNVLLFLSALGGLEYLYLTFCSKVFGIYLGSASYWGSGLKVLAAFSAFLGFEFFLLKRLKGGSPWEFLTPLLLTHLPWALGFGTDLFSAIPFPYPHDNLFRKMEVLLGLMLVTHVFLFTRLLLSNLDRKWWKQSGVIGVAALFLFTATTFWTATICDPSGDEPHYLLMAYSLVHDGDLDLSNNYQNKDYEQFYGRGELQPQALEHVADGKRYSHHPLGPVLLVLPGFALLGRLGAALTMALIAALALFLTLRVIEETGGEGWPVHATGIVGLFSSPILLFSGLIYPEIPTACLVALSLWLFIRKRWVGLGLSLGAMLWMHNRNVLLVIPFIAILLYEVWKLKKRADIIGRLAAGFWAPTVVLAFYFNSLYGVLTPLGAHNEPFGSLFRLNHFWIGFFGLIFDQECGFCIHFPIFALMVLGGALLYRSKNPVRRLALGVSLFYFLFMSFYENLGLTPAARYFVSIVPLLLILIYPAIQVIQKGTFGYYSNVFALIVGVFFNWILAAIPWMRYNRLNGENWVLKIAGDFLHVNLTQGTPSFLTPVINWQSYAISIFWVVVTIGGTIWYMVGTPRRSMKRS